jgi:hypothetical protein
VAARFRSMKNHLSTWKKKKNHIAKYLTNYVFFTYGYHFVGIYNETVNYFWFS